MCNKDSPEVLLNNNKRLSVTESRLFRAFTRHELGMAHDYEALIQATWGKEYLSDPDLQGSAIHMLRVNISRLRKKIEGTGWRIVTRRSEGSYMMETETNNDRRTRTTTSSRD